MKCYIAGKIGNLPDDVWQANFKYARLAVRALGYDPVCPTQLPHNHDRTWESYMKEDLTALLQCDLLYAQRNWKESRGATIEVNLAKTVGIEIIYQP